MCSAEPVLELRNTPGHSARRRQVLGARLRSVRMAGFHQQQLMIEIELVEIHGSAPRRKRERGGLSATGAYSSESL